MNDKQEMTDASQHPTSTPLCSSAVGSEMAQRTSQFDWSQTPVGPMAEWPQSLKIAVRIVLDSRYAMWLGWGPEFTFFYNDAYARMTLGPRHPWALGRSAREVWSEIWEDIGPRAESVVRTGQATWDERLLLILERRGFPEETYHTFSYSPVPDDQGGIGGMLCVVTEDTERTIGERRLRTLRELAARTNDVARSVEEACGTAVRTLAANPHDVPFVLLYLLEDDGQGAKLLCQAGVQASSSCAPAEVDLDESLWPFREVVATGSTVVVEDVSERFGVITGGAWPEPIEHAVVMPMVKPGQVSPAGFVVTGVSPRLVFNDEYRGFLDLLAGHIATAIVNARIYEEERRRAEALAELDRAKTAFFSNVSHEFRTPLTLMLGPVEDALSGGHGELPPSQRTALEVAHRNGLRLQRLVNTLLDFSRIEAGRARASYEPTDLAAFTADLASNFRSACDRAGLKLKVDCPPLDETAFVDRQMWEKIVLNLLSNAFKFTFVGEISVSVRQSGRHAEVRVRDTGTGIPADEMQRLFERFHRIENARGRTNEGSGIGLALVQELVKLHGGSITAESEVDKGTTFIIMLPLGSSHLPRDQVATGQNPIIWTAGASSLVEEVLRWLPQSAGENAEHFHGPLCAGEVPSPHASMSQPRVLVADDNADMRQYIVRLLSGHYSVDAVSDGMAALAAVRSRPPDLIVTDVMMPQLDGFGLLQAVRAEPKSAAIPVIVLSARAGEESRVEGMRAGADDYLVKPFSAGELLARVSSHLTMAQLRREATQSLRASEEHLRAVIETTPACIKLVAADGTLLEMNQSGLEMVEVDSLEVVRGKSVYDIISEEHRDVYREFNKRICEGKKGSLEFDIVGLGGTKRHMLTHAAPLTGPNGEVRQLAITHDITEHKRAEAATRRHSEQLRRLAEIASRLNAALDVASITGVVTEEARLLIGSHQAVTGFTVDNNWGQAINSVSLSDKYSQWQGYDEGPNGSGVYSLVCSTNKSLRMTQAELEVHPDFRWFGQHATNHPPLRGWLAAPMVGRDGRNIGLIQLSDKFEGDFTQEDEAILVQLAQMASVAIENAGLVQDLRDSDRRKDEFLATLAHELRNPLAPIRNGLQIMRMANGDMKSAEQVQQMMERQLNQMVHLVDDLLDLSRISRGKIDLRKERVELAKVVQQAIETSRPAIEQAGHDLTITMPPDAIVVDADVTRLSQVIANLLNNAAKYTEPNGRIQLTVQKRDGEAVIAVKDNGVGIPAHMLPKVFDMFTQVDRNLARSQGGLGIGLSIVKRLVEMHEGQVAVHSEGQGLGSEFTVRLPLASPLVLDQTPDVGTGVKSTNRFRILTVDDNRDSATSLAMMLKLMGHEAQAAYDGVEALELVPQFKPDVVLLDIGMPKLDGYETARRLRGQAGGKETILIALTGWGQDEDRRRSHEAGFDHHVTKPVDIKQLARILASLRPAET
ncbi:MAG TPA: ATP-binding protein [Pirellulales bacterium]|nr:ATP-binding protein [Pirellulales bacterium]